VRSIVVNLVENARKYAPVDCPNRRTSRSWWSRAARRRGGARSARPRPGVAPEERERVFQAFYRVGNEATRTARGTGLGLHLVALHAESVGGHAQVRDREGGGAVFSVTFPPAPPEHG
jgi:signal transduction histidine kinase